MTFQVTISNSARDDAVRIAANLGRVPPEVRKNVRRSLRQSGNSLARAAKSNAAWSSTIPGLITVTASFRAGREGVVVRAKTGTAGASRATRPYEGITGNRSFRRQVFGRKWVTQATRPYMRPAAQAEGPQAVRDVQDAITEALRAAGL